MTEEALSIRYDKKSNLYRGFLFELWEYIAKINNFVCQYTPLEGKLHNKKGKTYNEAVDFFSKSRYDVCIGDFSATAERAKKSEVYTFSNVIKTSPSV